MELFPLKTYIILNLTPEPNVCMLHMMQRAVCILAFIDLL